MFKTILSISVNGRSFGMSLCFVSCITAGCSEQPKPVAEVPVPIAKPLVTEAASPSEAKSNEAGTDAKTEPYEATVGGFRFLVPPTWTEQPPKSQFVLGEFSIPGAEGAARLTVSSAGGGVEANLERWRGQFSRGPNDPEPKESEITFDGQKGTLLDLVGSYTDMFGGGKPNRNWRMLGIAVPMGSTNVFVKLTGPQSTVTDQREAFLKFVESAKTEK
jgi:hypothetical protein